MTIPLKGAVGIRSISMGAACISDTVEGGPPRVDRSLHDMLDSACVVPLLNSRPPPASCRRPWSCPTEQTCSGICAGYAYFGTQYGYEVGVWSAVYTVSVFNQGFIEPICAKYG